MDKAPYIFLIVTGYLFLLGLVESKSCFSSVFIRKGDCGGGNLIKIHTGLCKMKHHCNVSVTGTVSTDKRTKDGKEVYQYSQLTCTGFTVVDVDSVTKRKCIQFIDERGTTYALKVINSTNRVRFEQYNGCNNSTSDDFLFEETETRYIDEMKTFRYEHKRRGVSSKRCLGVIKGCEKKLYLLSPGNNRRCLFSKIIV